MTTATLLISCPDKKGITATITDFIYRNNGNIEHADQHIDKEFNTFFMRLEWSLEGFLIPTKSIAKRFSPLAKKFGMSWNLFLTQKKPNVAIFASHALHCLHDLLLKSTQDYFNGSIALVISNHKKVKDVVRSFGVPFYYLPKQSLNKENTERKELALLKRHAIELIILARYSQIFTKNFVDAFPNKIINIHHSFLPAFKGSDPYRQAYAHGVKIIGATSHYVTKELDAGPIIEQDIVRINHRSSLQDLKKEGQELERIVLSRAVRWHLERKILTYNNKTVVFE